MKNKKHCSLTLIIVLLALVGNSQDKISTFTSVSAIEHGRRFQG
jgi:hypothetical protein